MLHKWTRHIFVGTLGPECKQPLQCKLEGAERADTVLQDIMVGCLFKG